MGAKGSKPSTPMGRVPTVPKNTPLAYILDNWRYFPGTLGKDKQKMIEYCTKIWGGKKISKNVFWPVCGSEEDWEETQGPQADIKWPLQRPNWDNQDPMHRTHMQDLRTIVIQGIREAVPRGQNINKACNEMQKKKMRASLSGWND